MRRNQLEHAIRTACQIIHQSEVIVVGSQAILGTYDESQLPAAATMSIEVDILPMAETNDETARLADLIEGVAASSRRSRNSTASASTASTSRRPYCPMVGATAWSRCRTPTPRGRRRTALHRLVPRQGGSLRREADHIPREGPQLRRCSTRSQPRARGPDRIAVDDDPK
jgi:hypothetical protein